MSEIETVKVDNPAEAGGYMIINKSDFDPERHKLFGMKTEKAETTKQSKGSKATKESKDSEKAEEPKGE